MPRQTFGRARADEDRFRPSRARREPAELARRMSAGLRGAAAAAAAAAAARNEDKRARQCRHFAAHSEPECQLTCKSELACAEPSRRKLDAAGVSVCAFV